RGSGDTDGGDGGGGAEEAATRHAARRRNGRRHGLLTVRLQYARMARALPGPFFSLRGRHRAASLHPVHQHSDRGGGEDEAEGDYRGGSQYQFEAAAPVQEG